MTDANDPPSLFPPSFQVALSKFDTWHADSLRREEAENKIASPLYHYTYARGLRGIFESERIWFTDYRHLNDPSELLHGIEVASDVAGRLKTRADGRAKLLLDCFIDMFRQENFDKALEFYIASFSHARNDLGQWRAYADNGRGFAIGFVPRMFETVDSLPIDKPAEFVAAVKYALEDIDALYAPPILEAAQLFLSEAITNADLIKDKAIGIPFMQKMVRHLTAALIWRIVTTKHPAYGHEREVRLVITGPTTRLSPYVKTRLRGSEIVPYIPQPWSARFG